MNTPFGDATQISASAFIEGLLPPVHPKINVDDICDRVKVSNIFNAPVTKNGRLWGYSTKTPSVLKTRNAAAFKGLQISAGKLARAVGTIGPALEFKNNDKAEWSLKNRFVDSLPDAYLLFGGSSRHRASPEWTSIAVPGAYSKVRTKTSTKDNATKILRCFAQCMHRDARRRYVYGFTVEDCSMRLWYCDRQQIIVSASFDFVTEWSLLFRFLLRVMFAEIHDLGLDPSMQLLDDTKSQDAQYLVTVRTSDGGKMVYRTMSILSDTDRDSLLGRGTRVWEAVKMENGIEVGETVVLKDSWVDVSREREGATDARIRESATDDEHIAALKIILLTILAHGDVFVEQAPDFTKLLPADNIRQDASQAGPSRQPLSTGVHSTRSSTPRRRAHYRIVYQEVCRPLHAVTSLFSVFKALGDACNALRVLHGCGWVHRDISTGNILLFKDSVKLADLEFAARMDSIHDHKRGRIGTHYFMAYEVDNGAYMFIPSAHNIPAVREDHDESAMLKENAERMKRGEPLLSPPRHLLAHGPESAIPQLPSFRYNHLHDLESLWWIAVYFVVHQIPDGGTDQDSRRQRRIARGLFWNGSKRFNVLKCLGYFEDEMRSLHSSLHRIAQYVEEARRVLVSGYWSLEGRLQDPRPDLTLHNRLVRKFWSIAATIEKADPLVNPIEYKLYST
ncbi:hypothetical protein EIP86_006164 [Pleurotus ostreatoroseus]|nr:hypothetical protein EIP86_006164 [Pleurotus ostreatoroseus]